ncbi:uncharacterized protein METZ01_LOCUS148227, partial [marine metagenome]
MDDSVLTENINSITYLNVNNDSISDLTGIEDFTDLISLKCQDNQLTSLNVSNNTALSTLHCRRNQLTNLDFSNNLSLKDIDVSQNDLVSIDLAANDSLVSVSLDNNELTAVTGINNKPNLEKIYLRNVAHWAGGNNSFDSLDVSGCPSLTDLYLGRGSLSSLDVTGCTSMSTLDVSWNELSTIDLSTLDTLRYFNGAENQFDSLDLSNNEELRELYIDDNELYDLDLSNNHILKHLEFADNHLTTIDLSNNLLLTKLFAIRNDLVSIDLAANDSLVDVSLSNNALTSVTGINNKPNLEGFSVRNVAHWGGYNNITSLDLSGCPSLESISCQNNQLTYLDLSGCPSLTYISCYNNQLTHLNMRNGVTDALTTFNATNNDSLECIETLDPDYATTNWTFANDNIDDGVTFSVLCGSSDLSYWHVDTTGSDGQGAGTAESPFASIQTGINIASIGDTVSVAAGTYVENISYSGKSISIMGEDRETTIVDGDTSGGVFFFEGDDQHTIALSGFTITNGESGHGAGIYIRNSIEIDLFDLNVNENNSTGSGAGGGIHIHDSMGELHNIRIENNEAYSGGGIYMGNSDIILDHVDVLNNNGRNRCGGTGLGSDQFDESTTEWYNSVFSGNTGLYQGSAMCMGDSVILSNLTITQNTTYNSALSGSGNLTIINSIIWENLVSANVEEDAEINFGTGTLNLSYTILSGEINSINQSNESEIILGDGIIDADPLFVDPDNGDFHLSDLSPAISGGIDSLQIDNTWYVVPSTDIEGNPRPNPVGTLPDMGAYENENGIEGYNGPVYYVDASSDVTYANGSPSAK